MTKTAGSERGLRQDDGFTLVEMMVALLIMGVVLTALAAVLTSSMKALSIQKARTRANEIATQGIESLQRYDFNSLGVCPGSLAASPPAGLTDVVYLPACPAGAAATPPYDDPCGASVGATNQVLIPRGTYVCNTPGIDPVTYTVRRYVAWADPAHVTKRLAVYVTWTDAGATSDSTGVRRHEVSQQSSLKAPDQGADIGLGPPRVTNVSVVPAPNPIELTGEPGTIASGGTIAVAVDTENNTSCAPAAPSTCLDSVYVSIRTLDATNNFTPITSSVALVADSSGTHWTGSISAANGFTFSSGSQYLTVGIVRRSDGKQNSKVADTLVQFSCPACVSTPPSFLATESLTQTGFTPPAVPPPEVHVAANGALSGDVQINDVTTRHLTATDSVTLTFPTKSGAQSIAMTLQNCVAEASGLTRCTWRGSLSASAGYVFISGASQAWYLTAQQTYNPANGEDRGSTAARRIDVSVVSP